MFQFRKSAGFALVLALLASTSAHADIVNIACSEAPGTSRSDEVKKVLYQINAQSGSARVGCQEQVKDSFCGSMRLDLSRSLGAVSIDSCRGAKSIRRNFSFLLTQEDEFDDFVTLTVTQDCKSGLIGKSISGVITTNTSGEGPQTASVVSCWIVR